MLRAADSLIVTEVTRFLIPLIQLFSFYVIFHGHYSPGGGFQGGALLAASLILQRIVFGQGGAQRIFPTRTALLFGVGGLLLYGAAGMAGWLTGHPFLDYAGLAWFAPEETAASLRSTGILLAELGVAAAVVGTLVAIFDLLTHELSG